MSLFDERTGIEKKFLDLCEKVVSEEGYTLYDMEYIRGSFTLRLFIMDDSTGTALIEDCVKIDRAMTPYIEESDWMPEELNLEVSSPGAYRQLRAKWHFERVLNEQVLIQIVSRLKEDTIDSLPKSLKGQKKFVATLVKVNDDSIVLNFSKENFDLCMKFEDIRKATLEMNINK